MEYGEIRIPNGRLIILFPYRILMNPYSMRIMDNTVSAWKVQPRLSIFDMEYGLSSLRTERGIWIIHIPDGTGTTRSPRGI